MSLLSVLFRKPVAPEGRPLQAAVRGRFPAGVVPPRPGRAAPAVALQQPRQRTVPAQPSYKSRSELPKHKGVASLDDGRFKLPPAQRQHMFVLELDDEVDSYCVVATKEYFGSAPYTAATARIAEQGCRLKACGTADAALIQAVNKVSRDQDSDETAKLKPLERQIRMLAEAALSKNVSDIHIENRGTYARVRMRVNGRLELYSDSWEPEYVNRVARALHTLADNDSKSTTFQDDGQMSVSMDDLPGGVSVKLRVQLSPAYPDGMDIVIRLLRVAASAKVKTLESLGYAPDHVEMLEYMQSAPHGLIVVAGTTGSGKSTTLQTLMQNLRKADPLRKLISVEDPPEYVLEGVTQIPVPRRGDKPFVGAMRNAMRMDPDIIMVGEIRDSESAELMVGMTRSGHKTLTTIHTGSALSVYGRLLDFGVGNDALGEKDFITGLIFQTLVPTLCEHCRLDYHPGLDSIPTAMHERIRGVIQDGDTLFIESPNGCEKCVHTGISGRTVCAEMVIPDDRLREFINARDINGAHAYWRSQRKGRAPGSMIGATALEHAIMKMRRGDVSPVAVEGALGLLHDFQRDGEIEAVAGDLLGLN